jgi:hypothetical protein
MQSMARSDRRVFERLKLAKPILAKVRSANALILDVGIGGAFLEHYGTSEPGERFEVSFRWKGEDIIFVCEVVHSEVVQKPGGDGESTVSHTGVHFVKPIGDAKVRLHDLITTFVDTVLSAQKKNASGEGTDGVSARILATLGDARRRRSRGFVSWRLKDGTWWRVPTSSPRQPADGFTVGTYEDEEELSALRETYERADEEGRRLIRLVAELSVQPLIG